VAWRHKDQPGPVVPPGPPPTVRVLHGDAELAAAAERAAEGQRRLQARLEARAARDAWTALRRQATDGGTPPLAFPGSQSRPGRSPAPRTPAA